MNLDNKKLGKGLGALLTPAKKTENKDFEFINISEIQTNQNQPRKNFNNEELQGLANSIKSQGVLQPIVVRRLENNNFEIIAGERRWRAAQIAEIHQIPALIKEMDDKMVQRAALIENIQRENLNAVEEARAYKDILENEELSIDKLSLSVGKSKSHISNMIRLLELDDEILNHIVEGRLTMGHARALIGVPNAKELANEIINKKLSVRQVEKNTSDFKINKTRKSPKDPNILSLESELSEKIGLKTSIQFNEQGSSGSLTLYYSDLDQLDDIMKRLKKTN
jgi:ParB family chromosome partitioning protein